MEYIEDLPSDTTANIYTHLKQEALCKASVNMEKSFASRSEPKSK